VAHVTAAASAHNHVISIFTAADDVISMLVTPTGYKTLSHSCFPRVLSLNEQ